MGDFFSLIFFNIHNFNSEILIVRISPKTITQTLCMSNNTGLNKAFYSRTMEHYAAIKMSVFIDMKICSR